LLSLLQSMVKRAVIALPTLFGVVVASFVLTRLLPGDPAVYFAGAAPTPEAIADIRKAMLLDRPLWEQFISYVINLLHGDLGRSLTTGQPVIQDLAARMPATLELTGLSLVIALSVSIPLGILGALRKGRMIDHVSRLISTTALSMPAFFSGLLLVFVFYYLLGMAPAPLGRIDPLSFPPPQRSGLILIDGLLAGDFQSVADGFAHLALPSIALALAGIGPLTRITRGAMLTVLSSDFIRAARSYDMPRWRLVYVYALRNAMLPVLTTAGFVFSFLISANVVVEKVFSWPGIGSYALEALVASDYGAVQGFVLAVAILYVLINILIDLLYGIVDVRVRLAE
jgi:ABC-type dipeptide/oligopeptide/nickel transport system permease component